MSVINIGLAFVEGFALIISPCILPIIPIIFAVGVNGGRMRSYGLMIGFIVSFCALTLLSRALILSTHINAEWLRQISFYLLLLLGIIMMSSYLSAKFSFVTQGLANTGEALARRVDQKSGFFNGLLLGLPIGLIWTPCAGPILAAVIVQIIRQQTTIETIALLFAFSIGVALPLLLFILFGQKLMTNINFLKRHAVVMRKILGAMIVVTVLITAQSELWKFSMTAANAADLSSTQIKDALAQPYPTPEIQGISAWINSPPLTMAQLKGKVVLIDFWTYSCINCQRTLPYITAWDKKYRDQGLVIIGVHSPEFAFEHDLNNVQSAVTQFGIHYPVALDNDLTTWQNFNNEYWPAHYLIDKNGKVVYTHFGEGDYDVTENNIRVLLGMKPIVITNQKQEVEGVDETPETYLGYTRADRFANQHALLQSTDTLYIFPSELSLNEWALNGHWDQGDEKITALTSGSAIRLHFNAKKVFLVMGSSTGKPITVQLLLNNKPVGNNGGKDVQNSQVVVTSDTLYELLNLPSYQSGILEITAQQPGVIAYAFTFGG